jgi:predicted transcriptional regulator
MPEEIKMTIRLTPDLHGRLDRAAGRQHRSKHAQMLIYIERGLQADEAEAAKGDDRA